MATNGTHDATGQTQDSSAPDRAGEVEALLNSVQALLIPFIRSADKNADFNRHGHNTVVDGTTSRTTLSNLHPPAELKKLLAFNFDAQGQGREGVVREAAKVLQYSVNTWDQGFLDKLYASTNAIGLAAELLLAALNTNVHVYQVSPVLTIVEQTVTQYLASAFGLSGDHAGGISTQGGSASNQTSVVIARNTLFPETKVDGHGNYNFVLFTSAHGHYSLEKAAQMLGMGSSNVWSVPVDQKGRLIPLALEALIEKAKSEGRTPFYVNATAGTTVLGSFDLFIEIAEICKKHCLWFHIDAAWGGSFIFSSSQKRKLSGSHLADSISFNPHKMLGVPITCSFLLGADIRQFHQANTLPAGYLFHNQEESSEIWDLADMTLQCGRRGDALKLFLGLTYYGTSGYASQIDRAVSTAKYLADLITQSSDLTLVSENPPPSLQVCFYYSPDRDAVYNRSDPNAERKNSSITEEIARRLIPRGFMVDFAPPTTEESRWQGKFFRAVVNRDTKTETIDGLVKAVVSIGTAVSKEMLDSEIGANGRVPGGKVLRPPRPGERGHGPVVRT